MHSQIISGLYTTLINLSPMAYRERTKQRERERGTQAIITTLPRHCHEDHEHPTEGPSTTGILKPDEFGSRGLPSHPPSGRHCTWTLVDPVGGTVKSSGKCNKTAISASRGSQWTPLVAAASTRPSIRSTVEDSATAREGISSDLSSTRSQIRVAELRRAWSSSCITRSCLTASSRRATKWARPSTGPRTRS
jgi:hypothetical protein